MALGRVNKMNATCEGTNEFRNVCEFGKRAGSEILGVAIPRSARPNFVEEHGAHSSSVRQLVRGTATHPLAPARSAIVAVAVRTTNDSMVRQTADCRIFLVHSTRLQHQE